MALVLVAAVARVLGSQRCVERVDLAVLARVVGRVRVVAAVDGEPLVLRRGRQVVGSHPRCEIGFGVQRRRVACLIEQQERLRLDADAAPAEGACVAELRAVVAFVRDTEHTLELLGAQRDENRRQFEGVEVTKAHGEAEIATRLRRLERESAAVVLPVRIGDIGRRTRHERLAVRVIGVFTIEVELATRQLAGRVVTSGVSVGHERGVVREAHLRAALSVDLLLEVVLHRAWAGHTELLEEGRL